MPNKNDCNIYCSCGIICSGRVGTGLPDFFNYFCGGVVDISARVSSLPDLSDNLSNLLLLNNCANVSLCLIASYSYVFTFSFMSQQNFGF